MLSSVLTFHSKPPSPRNSAHSAHKSSAGPPLPPRRHSLSTAPATPAASLQRTSVTLATAAATMDSRHYRPSSPRGRYANPARSSTGTFTDPNYDSTYYAYPTSPRASVDRVTGSSHPTYYTPSSSSGARASNVKYDSYAARPRRNTNDQASRPNVSSLTSLPIRSSYTPHSNLDRPVSPLAKSWDSRGDAFSSSTQPRQGHKKVYSVDDSSRKAQLVAERDVIEPPRHRDSADRGYSLTSGGRSYHTTTKAPARLTDLGDDGYSYTDPASMYRDTEPAWRRPRAGSLERGARPTSMILDRPARSSARELGPPPSTRGFDKINNSVPRSHVRSSSHDKSREVAQYDPYPDTAPTRSSSNRHHAPAIHQEPRESRRETYHDDYDRRDREVENRRHNTADRYEDREVAARGFGIAQGDPSLAHEHHALDRQPIWPAHDTSRSRPEDRGTPHYPSDRVPPSSAHMPEPRLSRDRDVNLPQDSYDKAPRERESSRHDSKSFIPAAAGAAAGMAATGYIKSRDKERREDRDLSEERERERRREPDDRDRRERYDDRRDDRRDRRADERRDAPPPAPGPVSGYPSREDERKPRERRYEDEDREKPVRKAPSSEGSGDERPRHYVDRDADRRKESAPKEAALDPDEEYRRRIQQEAERSSNSRTSRDTRDRNEPDADRDQDRRRRKDERDRSRGPEDSSRYDERSSSLYDSNIVQEPESMEGALVPTSKSVQIVEPAKDPQPAVKGILRRPTEKFPEDPEPIREGVAPHKDALKGKDIPVGARWTRIDRRLVNPEALEQAKERFEERMDCVIVLRVLTKQEIQKLADRTKKIREAREEEDRREREEKRGHRSSRDDGDDEDRDSDRDRDRDRPRRRRYDDDDYDDLDREYKREREPERDRSKLLEPARQEKKSKEDGKSEHKNTRDNAVPLVESKDKSRKKNPKVYSHYDGHRDGRHGRVDGTNDDSRHQHSLKDRPRRDSAMAEDKDKAEKKKYRISKVLGWL